MEEIFQTEIFFVLRARIRQCEKLKNAADRTVPGFPPEQSHTRMEIVASRNRCRRFPGRESGPKKEARPVQPYL